jgi:RNA 2',3'-cyclic 3'-phosphodiesterase
MKELHRTFVAILIPEAWTEYLRAVARDLGRGTSGLSWVKPENVHVTVRFLGDLGDDGVARLRESVRRSAAPLRAPVARLGPLGAFPRPEHPRVVWAGLAEGQDAVGAVAAAVERGLRADGFGRAEKPFRAHLTLARVREGASGVGSIFAATLPEAPPAEPLPRLAVMKSELHPSGARYNVFEEIRLPAPA